MGDMADYLTESMMEAEYEGITMGQIMLLQNESLTNHSQGEML